MPEITILYANHWPEVVPLVADHVGPGDLLVTEDAPSAEFRQMLSGEMAADDYLPAADAECRTLFETLRRRTGVGARAALAAHLKKAKDV